MDIHVIEANDAGPSFINLPPPGKLSYRIRVMKHSDIVAIHEAGLISDRQRDQIIAHFGLREEAGRFLVIIAFLGAALIAAGVALFISAHWNVIPHGIKIAAGLALMLGAHGAGGWLREVRGQYRKTGEALQCLGSALFLANIALVGQIYNLAGRTPDVFLVWWLGLAALPWLLRSKAQFILFLTAISIWFGCELNERDSLIYFGGEAQLPAYALLGLNFLGAGYCLRRTAFAGFAPVAEKIGLLGLLGFSYPLTWAGFWGGGNDDVQLCRGLLPVLAGLAVTIAFTGVRHLPGLVRQWRFTWAGSLAVVAGLLCATFFAPHQRYWLGRQALDPVNAVAVIALFVFCLLQIQTGLQLRSRFLVNLGVTFIGLDMLSAYFGLFGTMTLTGLMFVVTGMFLLLFGVYLEKKRRRLLQQMKSPIVREAP
jgi:uncharacterized membrane protein